MNEAVTSVVGGAEIPLSPTGAVGCPRHARRMQRSGLAGGWRAVRWSDVPREPFRLFFPLATVVGVLGVMLWPALYWGWITEYPGPVHVRLMVQGFFGGFIFGFLGTSMPKLLEVKSLTGREVLCVVSLYLVGVVFQFGGWMAWGDAVFALELVVWFMILRSRFVVRKSLPPPGFSLVGLAFVSGLVGTAMPWLGSGEEGLLMRTVLGKFFACHAFVLLCVLGAGGFLLPRFLGLGVRRKFVEARLATPEWTKAACVALGVGVLLCGTYVAEALKGGGVWGVIRSLLVVGYLVYEMPMEKLRWRVKGVHALLVLGLAFVPLGILAFALLPGMTATWLHLELMGGFGLITVGVATRVIYGHSGFREKLEKFHPWLTVAGVLMVLGLLSRVSGDFLPGETQMRHYVYAAVSWALGMVLWLGLMLSKLGKVDTEE